MKKRLYALLSLIATLLAPLTAFAFGSEAACDLSNYKAPGGLLADLTHKECTACGQCDIADFFIVGNTIVKLILGLSGSVMLLMVVYGGFLWLSSAGNSSQVDKGKKVVTGALIGLVIVFGAYTAVQFILGALGLGGTTVSEIFSRPFQTTKK